MTATILADLALARLVTWLSPAFPVGGFSYSHGLEHAVDEGLVRDAGSLGDWIGGVLRFGCGRVDSAFLAAAWRAEDAGDEAALAAVIEMADARRPTAELALESAAQGQAFLAAVRAAWPGPALDRFADALQRAGRPPAHAVAVGVAAAQAHIPLRATVIAFLAAFAGTLASAGVRLIPLGQTDGLRVLARVEADLGAVADAAIAADPRTTGAATAMVDWASARHETQHVRLFRS